MTETDRQTPLHLEGELNIYTAAEVRLRLLDTLTRHGDPQLDLSAVTDVDTAGLQLLMLAQREAAHRGKRLHSLNPSPVVVEVLELCNLTARFGLSAGCAPHS